MKHCTHPNAYIEKACCSPFQLFIQCACGGRDVVVCPEIDCDGITEDEAEEVIANSNTIFEREEACFD